MDGQMDRRADRQLMAITAVCIASNADYAGKISQRSVFFCFVK